MKLKPSKRRPDRANEADGRVPEYMQWILNQVAGNGWAVPGVPGDTTGFPWGYSIGLWATFGHPDLAAFGRTPGQLGLLLKTLCQRVAAEETISPGDELDDACPARLAVRAVHDSWRATSLFHVSDEFHGYIRPPMLQVVWADPDGHFPWEQRFEPLLADSQPRLWLPVDDHPPGPWTSPDLAA
jgi:hypothetical protein